MTLNSYGSLCDDFYIDMYINTELDLPSERDTILAFFERLQKQYPAMSRFYRRANNEYCLEEESSIAQHRWITLEIDRVGSGVVNPSDFESAYCQDRLVLELVPYMLGVSHLDVDSLDVTFAMDFDYVGNHDEVIAEALFASSAFNCLLELPFARDPALREPRPIVFSPAMVVALTDDDCTQARISVESKTSVYMPRKKTQSPGEAISLSFTIRQYPRVFSPFLSYEGRPGGSGGERFDALKSFEYQRRLAEELMAEKIVPNFVQPLVETIAHKRLT